MTVEQIRWGIIGILISAWIPLLIANADASEVSSMRIIYGIIGLFMVIAGAWTVHAAFFAKTLGTGTNFDDPVVSAPAASTERASSAAAAPATAASLEDEENAALLIAAGYSTTGYLGRWERPTLDADAPFEEWDVIVYDDGQWQTSGSYFVVLNECAWAPGSARYFENRNRTKCALEPLLENPKFRERLTSARHLVFVGMESNLNAPRGAASEDCLHELLTECRADELVTKTYNAMFKTASVTRPELWELDIGHAKTASIAEEWDQRRAVILGIRNRRAGLSVEDAITKVATGAKIGDVKLTDYSRIQTAAAKQIPYDAWDEPSGDGYQHR